ncbi:hypothetical protein AYI69_g6455 [Smittium culicis]|uniref:Uncharacterized protein n=1 Tax=Smittium culicis TaxID=133412 RepID=A0A1R1XYR8_9FUNG|nr:hypothetical protein AYI69_g7806 [Smittium culicis]OMJ19837.1 hypothetical protein AYI69_g6455 [Smittium culicis]
MVDTTTETEKSEFNPLSLPTTPIRNPNDFLRSGILSPSLQGSDRIDSAMRNRTPYVKTPINYKSHSSALKKQQIVFSPLDL